MGFWHWVDRVTGAERRARQRTSDALAASGVPSPSALREQRMAERLNTYVPGSDRRWEAGKTTRLNQAHWSGVTGQPINADLSAWLNNLRHRCLYEIANNSLVEGMVNTYQLCVVGSQGPSFRCTSESSPQYANDRKAIWEEWSAHAGSNQQLSLVEILDVWIRDLFGCGEFFTQLINVPGSGPIELRLLPIHAYRCFTPPYMAGQPDVALGVRRDVANRRPLSYLISQPWIFQAFEVYQGKFDEIPYADMIHGFRLIEEDQVRGVPWLAPCLEAVAELRDFKIETLDAARAAADHAVLLTTQNADAPFTLVNETTDYERRTIKTMPPGWDATQMAPSHPGPQFIPFYEALAREIGGSIAMPLMMLLLDSSSSSYSSARFDGQMFWRGVAKTQGWLGRILLRVESLVALEAERAGLLPAPPVDVRRGFNWPKAPHVDPIKERTADRLALENGTISYSELCAAEGGTAEDVIAARKRDNELLIAAGLPTIPGIPDQVAIVQANNKADEADDVSVKERARMRRNGHHNGNHREVHFAN